MILLLSPAKIQQFTPEVPTQHYSLPHFRQEANQLVELMRGLSASELSKLLQINRDLTQLNLDRLVQWHLPFTLDNARQAAAVFDGEVFRGLNATRFTDTDWAFAQLHLRIFSGLYGVLRPLDLIQPYRLEVSSKLKNPSGRDLYPFWKEKVSALLLGELKAQAGDVFFLNLASSEYFKMTTFDKADVPVVDVEFYEYKHDTFRQVVMYTKKARGLLARYVITHRITTLEELKGFDTDGYWFDPQRSTENKLVFVR